MAYLYADTVQFLLCCAYRNTISSIIHISLQDQVDLEEARLGPSGNITLYQISFQTGSVVVTENVKIAECTAGRCSHIIEPPSNPPSSYDGVSVVAENVVGVGAARICTTQPISEYCYFHHNHIVLLPGSPGTLYHMSDVKSILGGLSH